MADHDQRAGVALQPGLEPDEGVEVQVVGRLVEQQQVGRAHQRPRELQAHAPAAGEAVDRRVELVAREAQAQQQRLRARHARRSRRRRPDRVQCACAIAVAVVRWPRRAASSASRNSTRRVSPSSTKSVAGSSVSGMSCATCAEPPVRAASRSRRRRRAGVPSSSANRRGLAGAVAADQADLLAGVEGDVTRVEQDLRAAAKRSGENEHRDFRRAIE